MALPKEELARFEQVGFDAVLLEIAEGKHGERFDSLHIREVMRWVEASKSKQSTLAESRRDRREEDTLSIARQARSDAKKANIIAIAAIICSIAATISAVIIGVMYQSPNP